MKNASFVVGLLLSTSYLFAQPVKPSRMPVKSLLTFDLLGQGTLMSLNYDHILYESGKGFLSGRVGIGFPNTGVSIGFFGTESGLKGIGIPHSLSWNFGKKHALEVGVGGMLSVIDQVTRYVFYPIVGYRFQPQIGKKFPLSIRAYVHPINKEGLTFPIGIGLGFALPGKKAE